MKVRIESPWGTVDISKPSDFLCHVISQLEFIIANQPEREDNASILEEIEGYRTIQATGSEELIGRFFKRKDERRMELGMGKVKNKEIIAEMIEAGEWLDKSTLN